MAGLNVLLGLLVAFLPAAAYVLAAIRPGTTAWSLPVLLAALAAGIAAWFSTRGAVRASAWASLVVTLAAAVVVPKMMWAARMGYCGFAERALLRGRIEAYRRAHGAYPATLDEVGPVPELRIWTEDGDGREHRHPATRRVALHPGLERSGAFAERPNGPAALPAGLADDGSWGYDPESGRVFVSCSGLDPKLRRVPLFLY